MIINTEENIYMSTLKLHVCLTNDE